MEVEATFKVTQAELALEPWSPDASTLFSLISYFLSFFLVKAKPGIRVPKSWEEAVMNSEA